MNTRQEEDQKQFARIFLCLRLHYNRLAVRSGKKSPNQETDSENGGRLNDTKLVLNEHE